MNNEILCLVTGIQSGILLNLLVNWLIKKWKTEKYVKDGTSIQIVRSKTNTNFIDKLASDGWIRMYEPWELRWKVI